MYVLGRRAVFEGCYELRQAFELLLQRPDRLSLVTGELWPSQRKIYEDISEALPGEAVMEGVEHLGQYVFEMTQTKIEQLRAERGQLPVEAVPMEAEVAAALPTAEESEEEELPVEGYEATEE